LFRVADSDEEGPSPVDPRSSCGAFAPSYTTNVSVWPIASRLLLREFPLGWVVRGPGRSALSGPCAWMPHAERITPRRLRADHHVSSTQKVLFLHNPAPCGRAPCSRRCLLPCGSSLFSSGTLSVIRAAKARLPLRGRHTPLLFLSLRRRSCCPSFPRRHPRASLCYTTSRARDRVIGGMIAEAYRWPMPLPGTSDQAFPYPLHHEHLSLTSDHNAAPIIADLIPPQRRIASRSLHPKSRDQCGQSSVCPRHLGPSTAATATG